MSEPVPDTIVSPTRQSLRVQDVALLAVGVLDQRNARRAIRIVLDLAHRARRSPNLSRLKSITRYIRL